MDALRRLRAGDLSLPTDMPEGVFAEMAEDINSLFGDGMQGALQNEVSRRAHEKRMITNVSHDLKNAADQHPQLF